jgi:integrase
MADWPVSEMEVGLFPILLYRRAGGSQQMTTGAQTLQSRQFFTGKADSQPLRREAPTVPPRKPELMDQLHEAFRSRHTSRHTEQAYCRWVKRFIHFHNIRHPAKMAEPEINAFYSTALWNKVTIIIGRHSRMLLAGIQKKSLDARLRGHDEWKRETDLCGAVLSHSSVKEKLSASTQCETLSALLSLYRHVIGREIGDLGEVNRARTPRRLPVVMTRDEIRAVLSRLTGDKRLKASLMYGAGLRLMECLRLRVQDIDFARGELLVRDGKEAMDRVTVLPFSLKAPLQDHLTTQELLGHKDVSTTMIITHVLNRGCQGVRSPMDGL